MFWILLRVFTGLGMFWITVVILEHFGDKDRRNSQLFMGPAIVDIQSQLQIDKHYLLSIKSEAREAGHQFMTDLKPKFHIFTKIPLANFNLIFMCSAIVLGNTRFLIFIPQSLWFLLVWREDPRLLQSFVLKLHFFYFILLGL